MKKNSLLFGALLTVLLPACSSTPVVLAPVGPNPVAGVGENSTGQLEVFSALQECRDGNEFDVNPAWYQHTDYDVYNLQGGHIEHVANTVGHYAEAPRLIALPEGRYVVKARARGYLQVEVPVVIERGRTTKVHLDAKWKPAVEATQLVSTPSGYPVGWRTDATMGVGMN